MILSIGKQKCDKQLGCTASTALPSPGEKVARQSRDGRGTRAITERFARFFSHSKI